MNSTATPVNVIPFDGASLKCLRNFRPSSWIVPTRLYADISQKKEYMLLPSPLRQGLRLYADISQIKECVCLPCLLKQGPRLHADIFKNKGMRARADVSSHKVCVSVLTSLETKVCALLPTSLQTRYLSVCRHRCRCLLKLGIHLMPVFLETR